MKINLRNNLFQYWLCAGTDDTVFIGRFFKNKNHFFEKLIYSMFRCESFFISNFLKIEKGRIEFYLISKNKRKMYLFYFLNEHQFRKAQYFLYFSTVFSTFSRDIPIKNHLRNSPRCKNYFQKMTKFCALCWGGKFLCYKIFQLT